MAKKTLMLILILMAAACSVNRSPTTGLSHDTAAGIVGGTPIVSVKESIGQHIVGLHIVSADQKENLKLGMTPIYDTCTGAIINDNTILTAAHCLANNPAQVLIVFATDLHSATPEMIRVGGLTAQPSLALLKWLISDKSTDGNRADIALLRFDGGLPAGYTSASLLEDSSVLKFGTSVRIAGYGEFTPDKSDKGVGILREADVPLLDPKMTLTEVSMDESKGKGTCHGDSGGPAFVQVGGQYKLWGVASGGTGSSFWSTVDLCNHLTVHTNVVPYLSWIHFASQSLKAE